jgi:hypothetical protein
MLIVIAYPLGLVEDCSGPATAFRLVVGKTDLPGRWLCARRRFVQLSEAAEDVVIDDLSAAHVTLALVQDHRRGRRRWLSTP